MGKRIIVQARGKGSMSYRVRRKAYSVKLMYPKHLSGTGVVQKLLSSAGHTAPIAKIKAGDREFFMPACTNMTEGQTISFDDVVNPGNILTLKNIPVKTQVYNIEARPGDGGKFIKTGGSSATVTRIIRNEVYIALPSKQERAFHPDCRATVGVVAGAGRLEKPIVKAGTQYFIKKSRNKLWPRTSAVKMNAIDHPFGSGRGKRIKSKIAKRNAPPGAKVGLIRPSRTGKRK